MIEFRMVDELTYDVFIEAEVEVRGKGAERWGDIQYHSVYGWIFFDYNTYDWFYNSNFKVVRGMIIDKYVNGYF